jgi:long-chain acyl-CoA synthetase
MKGYHNNTKADDDVFVSLPNHDPAERYFRTGDMGQLVEGRFLKITGRIKEQFKLENGKFVVPAPLEDIYCRGPFIAQTFIYGDNRPSTVLLVVPNYLELFNWATEYKKSDILDNLPANLKDMTKIGKDPEEIAKIKKLFKNEDFVLKITQEVSSLSSCTITSPLI